MEDKRELTDKDLHCIARLFQHRIFSDKAKECLYCKYALECNERAEKERKWYWVHDLSEKLEKMTGVKMRLRYNRAHKDVLAGSWLEAYPELLEAFGGMSVERQESALKKTEILAYARNPNPDLLETIIGTREDAERNKAVGNVRGEE